MVSNLDRTRFRGYFRAAGYPTAIDVMHAQSVQRIQNQGIDSASLVL
jgi:hypothetical protein